MKNAANFHSTLSVLIAFCCFISSASAQKSRSKPEHSIGFNLDKIELLYQNVEVTQTSSTGRSFSYSTKLPLLRINNGETQTYRSDVLLPYFKECPSARKEVNLFDKERKKSVRYFWGGFAVGGGLAFAGLFTTATLDSKGVKRAGIPFATGFGLGLGSIIYGAVKSHKAKLEADKHLRKSIEQYNLKCYKGAKPESAAPTPVASPNASDAPVAPAQPYTGVTEDFKEQVEYRLLRNDPQHLSFWAIGLDFLDVEVANNHGFNYRAGVDFLFQKGTKFGLAAFYKQGLVANLSAEVYGNEYANFGGTEAASADYGKGHEGQIVASIELFGRDREAEHRIYLGTKHGVDNYGKLKAMERVSWAFRGGANHYASPLFNLNGMPFASTAPARTVDVPDAGQFDVGFGDLDNAIVMLRSLTASVGISRRVFSDLKIDIVNSSFKGKKKDVGFTEMYADFVFPAYMKTGDVNYRFTEVNTQYEQFFRINTDATKMAKWGWRAGAATWFPRGTGYSVEIGQRPGPDSGRLYVTLGMIWRFGKELK